MDRRDAPNSFRSESLLKVLPVPIAVSFCWTPNDCDDVAIKMAMATKASWQLFRSSKAAASWMALKLIDSDVNIIAALPFTAD